MSKPISKDGVELKLGMRVCHFMADDFDTEAGEIIHLESRGAPLHIWDVVHKSPRFHEISTYMPHCLCTSEVGLLRSKIEDAEECIPRMKENIRKERELLMVLRSRLAKLEHAGRSESGGNER